MKTGLLLLSLPGSNLNTPDLVQEVNKYPPCHVGILLELLFKVKCKGIRGIGSVLHPLSSIVDFRKKGKI